MELVHSGKVRDVYRDGSDLILVASDRMSVFDVVLPTPIPDKGKILTQLSLWWFDQLPMPNHVISATDVPAEFEGRAIRCQPLEMVPVECVARGYLTGSGLRDYLREGTVSGVVLPSGLTEASRLETPIFTPSTKAPMGEHDQPMTFDEVEAKVGPDIAEQLRVTTLDIYQRGCDIALERGIIIADTKIELGFAADGTLTLGDEVLTPDSSRFWPLDTWHEGQIQPSFDKQPLRDWAVSTGWDKTAPGPEIPDDIVEETRQLYVDIYERLTGTTWR